jgi:hypothetical protein
MHTTTSYDFLYCQSYYQFPSSNTKINTHTNACSSMTMPPSKCLLTMHKRTLTASAQDLAWLGSFGR